MSRWMVAGAAFVALLSGCAVTSPVSMDRFLQTVAVNNVDLTTLPDGSYTGRYTIVVPPGHYAAYRSFEVEVTVASHSYGAISIVKPTALATNSDFASLIGRIQAQNSLLVDGVSGATYSSRAMLKAVESAVSR